MFIHQSPEIPRATADLPVFCDALFARPFLATAGEDLPDEGLSCRFEIRFSAVSVEHAHALALSYANGLEHLRGGCETVRRTATVRYAEDAKPVPVFAPAG